MFVVASLRVNLVRAPHKSLHRFPKLSEHRILFAPCAFKTLGPAPPLHFRATFLMYWLVSSAYRLSGTDSGVVFMKISVLAGSAGECFFCSWLIASGVGSRHKLVVPSISFPASPTLPDVTTFVKFRNNVLSDVLEFHFNSRFCSSLDSFMSSLTFPSH